MKARIFRLCSVFFFLLVGAQPAAWGLDGPFAYGGHDYYLDLTNVTWQAAQDEAVALGGHLATIDDAAENAFVTGLLPAGITAWIGLTDAAEEGTWVWVTGEPATYFNWNSPNEPNGGTNENCVEAGNTGVWNDLPCMTTRSILIEIDAPQVPMVGLVARWVLAIGLLVILLVAVAAVRSGMVFRSQPRT